MRIVVRAKRRRRGIEQRIAAHRLLPFTGRGLGHLARAARRIAVVVPGVVGDDDDQHDGANDGKSGLKGTHG